MPDLAERIRNHYESLVEPVTVAEILVDRERPPIPDRSTSRRRGGWRPVALVAAAAVLIGGIAWLFRSLEEEATDDLIVTGTTVPDPDPGPETDVGVGPVDVTWTRVVDREEDLATLGPSEIVGSLDGVFIGQSEDGTWWESHDLMSWNEVEPPAGLDGRRLESFSAVGSDAWLRVRGDGDSSEWMKRLDGEWRSVVLPELPIVAGRGVRLGPIEPRFVSTGVGTMVALSVTGEIVWPELLGLEVVRDDSSGRLEVRIEGTVVVTFDVEVSDGLIVIREATSGVSYHEFELGGMSAAEIMEAIDRGSGMIWGADLDEVLLEETWDASSGVLEIRAGGLVVASLTADGDTRIVDVLDGDVVMEGLDPELIMGPQGCCFSLGVLAVDRGDGFETVEPPWGTTAASIGALGEEIVAFVASGESGPELWSTVDGETWIPIDTDEVLLPDRGALGGDGELVWIGPEVFDLGSSASIMTSRDGRTWFEVEVLTSITNRIGPTRVGSGWVATGEVATGASPEIGEFRSVLYFSRDGIEWVPIPSDPILDPSFQVFGDTLVVGSDNGLWVGTFTD